MALARAAAQLRERGDRRGGHRGRLETRRRPRSPQRPAHAGVAAGRRDPATGHLSVVPVGGWGQGERRPGFDQQPIEVAALADACVRAAAVTGDSSWLNGVGMCVAWFLGDNDAKVPLLDEQTGGGYDGLGPTGRNRNQGAESTLAMISVLPAGLPRQHACGGDRRRSPAADQDAAPADARRLAHGEPAVRAWPGNPDPGRLAGHGGHRPRPGDDRRRGRPDARPHDWPGSPAGIATWTAPWSATSG